MVAGRSSPKRSRKLRGAGDQRRRASRGNPPSARQRALRPFRHHRRERVAHADQRRVLLDDGDRRRHDAQQRLVHRPHPDRAVDLLGGQQAARDELVDQRPPHRIAALERRRARPARWSAVSIAPSGPMVTSRTKAVMSAGSSETALRVEAGDRLLGRARDRGVHARDSRRSAARRRRARPRRRTAAAASSAGAAARRRHGRRPPAPRRASGPARRSRRRAADRRRRPAA